MKKEHLTPAGWKPCKATTRVCKYPEQRTSGSAFIAPETAPKPAFIDTAVEDVKAGKPSAIKTFFNNLFGSGKTKTQESKPPSSPKSDPALSEPSESFDRSEINKIGQTENGQYQVLCEDHWEKRMLVHKFGDLITDKTLAERLHNADPEKKYQLGDCGVIAGELWNHSEHVKEYYMLKTDSDPDFGIHHFVQLNDGTYADSLGIWTEEAFLSSWKEVDPSVRISTFDFEEAPESRDPNFPISNLELFGVVNELINKHMSGQKL